MTGPLQPSPRLLEKLAGIVHTALHEHQGSATDRLCRDADVIEWTQRMMALGLCPEPATLSGSGR
jgi:hypothetical protein